MLKGRSQSSGATVWLVFHIVSHKFGGYCAANLANVKITREKCVCYGCVRVIFRFRGIGEIKDGFGDWLSGRGP